MLVNCILLTERGLIFADFLFDDLMTIRNAVEPDDVIQMTIHCNNRERTFDVKPNFILMKFCGKEAILN